MENSRKRRGTDEERKGRGRGRGRERWKGLDGERSPLSIKPVL